MRILDIDLDFFLNVVPTGFPLEGKQRLSSEEYKSWDEIDVKRFIKYNLSLSTSAPVEGFFIQNHIDAFYYLRDLIDLDKAKVPFEVIHVDAHSDLGCGGDGGFIYIMTNLLHKPVEERRNPITGFLGLNSANFLAFAIANRWISSLPYITPINGINDVIFWHMKDLNINSDFIQLKKCNPDDFDPSPRSIENIGLISSEPEVPFKKVTWENYQEDVVNDFDFIIFCQSPTFTPVESDNLIPLITDFMIL